MDLAQEKARLMQYQAVLVKHLGEPAKLRVAVLAVLALVAVVAVYMPLSDRIDAARRRVAVERKRFETIADVEALRKQAAMYRDRIDDGSDTNEWVQYILGGIRTHQVKLRDMASKESQKVGPYSTVLLSMELESAYPKLKEFLEWLEQSDRLLRVESARFEKRPGSLMMKVAVMGLVKKRATTN